MPDFCALCGSEDHVVYVVGRDARLCFRCRGVDAAVEMTQEALSKPKDAK